ncbi:MAG: GlsB/YeaQ/YmgE family stress response membrane protein [Cyanobacteria bacterium P01_A01_bin.135]
MLGIIGSFIGGFLANLIQTGTFALVSSGLSLLGIILAIIGALIAIFIWQQIAKR